MKVQVRRFGILQVGILLGLLYGFFALVILPFMALSMVFSENRVLILMPMLMILLYPVMGFIAGIITAALYNLAARIVGGIKMELDVEPIPAADTTLQA